MFVLSYIFSIEQYMINIETKNMLKLKTNIFRDETDFQ